MHFIGPRPEHIRLMGDKIAAKRAAKELGIPVVPGSDGDVGSGDVAASAWHATSVIRSSSRQRPAAAAAACALCAPRTSWLRRSSSARAEAKSAFGDDTLYLEKYLERPRHIEIQVLGDGKGRAIHLGERDCSLQRRHQKVWEESPSPALNTAVRDEIGETVAKAMREIKYLGVGTVEFLYEDGKFYFIEMNTRIQVEHPVTEMLTDIDLILEQIRVAAGGELEFAQSDVHFHGHAIECRINAENPVSFRPSPGKIVHYHPPGGLGVRVDSAVYHGYTIPPYLQFAGRQAHRPRQDAQRMSDAAQARARRIRHRRHRDHAAVVPRAGAEKDIIDGEYHIHWLEEFLAHGEMTE